MEHCKTTRLTCGQMARANCVTEKTLRFYQKKGLLQPRYIDKDNGFRYYDIMQSTKLDMITHLQAVGFSLDDIKEIDESHTVDYLRQRTDERLVRIRERQRELAIAEQIASDLVHDCDSFLAMPICNQVMLESLPDRRILEFDISLDEMGIDDGDLSGSEEWEWIVRYVKQAIYEREWPLSLFRNVGYLVEQDKIEEFAVRECKAFVFVDESFGPCFEHARILSGGPHLTYYIDKGYADDGSGVDADRFDKMFAYADTMGFEVAGDLFCEAICRYQRFFNESLDSFARYCVPVRQKLS